MIMITKTRMRMSSIFHIAITRHQTRIRLVEAPHPFSTYRRQIQTQPRHPLIRLQMQHRTHLKLKLLLVITTRAQTMQAVKNAEDTSQKAMQITLTSPNSSSNHLQTLQLSKHQQAHRAIKTLPQIQPVNSVLKATQMRIKIQKQLQSKYFKFFLNIYFNKKYLFTIKSDLNYNLNKNFKFLIL